ncbi:MAG: hypothetical protein AAGC76_19680, partial [Luteibacter sp.]|uniref:hypothetical protein n=1 Tax=Luteibacter sp. TaxID=1886636 RepID=UPI00280805E2
FSFCAQRDPQQVTARGFILKHPSSLEGGFSFARNSATTPGPLPPDFRRRSADRHVRDPRPQ